MNYCVRLDRGRLSGGIVDLREMLLIAVRSAHALAAVALVGGSAFQLFVLAPALRLAGPAAESVRARAEAGFKEIVDLSLPVFLVSGGLMTFERLASGAAGTVYVAVLSLKLLLSLLLYRWAFQVRRPGGWAGPAARYLVGSGILVIFLATVLKTLYEVGLRPWG
jgi:uncharacterized membrane protein